MLNQEIQDLIYIAIKRGYEYFSVHNYENAEEIYSQVLRIDENNLEAMQMLVLTLAKLNKCEEAKSFGEKCLDLDPTNSNTWNNIGLIHAWSNNQEKAIECFQTASALSPEYLHFKTNLALEYKKCGQFAKANQLFLEALKLNDKNEHVLFNYGAFLHECGDISTAIDFYKKAIAINYNFSVCHYNLSACYFLLGDYEKGWEEYEWRWKHFSHFAKTRNRFSEPYWDGSPCQTLFLYAEQGVGDAIMFSRYVLLAKERVQRVMFECPQSLRGLFEQLPVEIVSDKEKADYHCSILSLPKIFGTTIDNVPKPFKLSSGLEASDGWKEYKNYFKVGVTWCGNPIHPNDQNRSCRVTDFFTISRLPGIKLFSLQKEYLLRRDGTDPHKGSGMSIVDMHTYMSDWKCTAGIIDQLDLVISVDTAVAHLAASMGKRVWLMVPFLPDWRWGLNGDTTPWYPSMRIFRQGDDRNWLPVFDNIHRELRTFCRLDSDCSHAF